MTHGRFYRLQLRTISDIFTNTQQQNADRRSDACVIFSASNERK